MCHTGTQGTAGLPHPVLAAMAPLMAVVAPLAAVVALLAAVVALLVEVPAQALAQLPDDDIGTPAPPAHPHTSPGCREVGKPGWRLGAGALMGLGPPGQRRAGPRQTKPPAQPVATRRCRLRGSQPTGEPPSPPSSSPTQEQPRRPGSQHRTPARWVLGGQQHPPSHQPRGDMGMGTAVLAPNGTQPIPWPGGGCDTGAGGGREAEPHSRPSRSWHHPHAPAGISVNGIYHFIQYSPKDEPGKGEPPPLAPLIPLSSF